MGKCTWIRDVDNRRGRCWVKGRGCGVKVLWAEKDKGIQLGGGGGSREWG